MCAVAGEWARNAYLIIVSRMYPIYCRSWLASDGGLTEYISIAAVTATYGFALTASHLEKRNAARPQVTKGSCP
ncbi:conserved hypothetical protein [Pseudomonas sp. IT-P218]